MSPGATPSFYAFFDNNHDGSQKSGRPTFWYGYAGSQGDDAFYDPSGSGGASHYVDTGQRRHE